MKQLDIAIIGAGPGGLTAAALLKQDGHRITVFEKFDQPKPVGAGLLIQPTGLAVLARLGLDGALIARGATIRTLYGKVVRSKFATLDLAYADLQPHLFGVGTHRNVLFSTLYQHVLSQDIPVRASQEITDAAIEGEKATLVNARGERMGPYDLVIDASGQKSHVRKKYAAIIHDKPYPYGALWASVKLGGLPFKYDQLEQRYRASSHMIGVLPVGDINGDGQMHAAFFWSIRTRDHAAWRAQPFAEWKRYVQSLWPETESILAQFNTHDDLTFATYSDGVLRNYHHGPILFIGDAAHCSSPQLGQGANLALVDALVLSETMRASDSVNAALTLYTKQRKKHVRFYQRASRALTPFYQSDSRITPHLRTMFGIGSRIPFARKWATYLLSGTCEGIFARMNPGQWSADYDLFKAPSKAEIA